MASCKAILLDYGLFVILALTLVRLLPNFHADDMYRYAMAAVSCGLILAVFYVQRGTNKAAIAHALGLTHVADDLAQSNEKIAAELAQANVVIAEKLAQSNVDIATDLKSKSDARQDVADRGREAAED